MQNNKGLKNNKAFTMGHNFYIFCSMLFSFCFVFVASACASNKIIKDNFNGQKAGVDKIAVLPFENLSDEGVALDLIMPQIKDYLNKEGFEIVDEEAMNKFLLKERVRVTGYISKELALKVRDELNANAILLGAISSFVISENPKVGIIARLIDTSNGRILWANYYSATGEDFIKILGLGKIQDINELISKVVSNLFISFISEPFKKEVSDYRIAVMPFQNKSGKSEAGMLVTYMFITELFKTKRFEVIEYGDVRNLIVGLRIREKGELNIKDLKDALDSLNVDGIVVGTVDLYSEKPDPLVPVEVDVSARLIDIQKKRILWYGSRYLNGDEDIIFFDWGKIRSVDKLAYKAISKLIKRLEAIVW